MSRSIVLSNGELCVALDKDGLVRDLYFPHIGYEDHVRGHYVHRVGVHVDGTLSWLGDFGWDIAVSYAEESLMSNITARNEGLQIELKFNDIVYNEQPIYLRKIVVQNLTSRPR